MIYIFHLYRGYDNIVQKQKTNKYSEMPALHYPNYQIMTGHAYDRGSEQ